MPDRDDLLTTAQVMFALNVDRSTLIRWVHSGRIVPAMKLRGLRGAYLFTVEEAERVKKETAA